MFECNDDIALDEEDDFLDGLFESEQDRFEMGPSVTLASKGLGCNQTFEKQHSSISKAFEKDIETLNSPNHQNRSAVFPTQTNFNGEEGPLQSNVTHSEQFQFNKENKRKLLYSPNYTKKKRERKFPGPAGLLPEQNPGGTPLKLDSLLDADKSPTSADDLCSQGRCSGSVLEDEPWQSFVSDLGPEKHILEEVNVASVKRKAAARCFVRKKVPFLAAIIHHLDLSSPDPCLILRDSTGEIHGTLHREVWQQFAGELVVGSVLVIRNVGLLSTGISSRRHYLNITANNLVTIYSANPDKSRKSWLYPFSSQDFVQTIQNWRSLVSLSQGVGSPASVGSPALFNLPLRSPYNNNALQSSATSNISAGGIPRRTEINKKLVNSLTPNVRHSVPKVTNLPGNTSRHQLVLRPTGKNLMDSFSPTSPVCPSKPINNLNSSNVPHFVPHVSRSQLFPSQNSAGFFSCKSPSNSNMLSQHSNPGQTSLRFSKVNSIVSNNKPSVLPYSKFNVKSFPQSNSDRQASTSVGPSGKQNMFLSNKNSDCCNIQSSSSNILPSQSSQLTAEEQSVVESVFDGIDADSLFDDDF